MKNVIKYIGIITVVAIIILVACDNGTTGDGITSTGSASSLSGTVSITGDAAVGKSLTAETSSLGGSGTISYQWKRSDTAVGEGTDISPNGSSQNYTVAAADVGKYIKVTVRREGYSGSITSQAVGPISNLSLDLAKALSDAIMNAGVYQKFLSEFWLTPGTPKKITSYPDITLNGSISGTATISNVEIDYDVKLTYSQVYGTNYKAYDYSYNNFSNTSALIIRSGTGSYLDNGYQNDKKSYGYDSDIFVNSCTCDVFFEYTSGITYDGNVSIKHETNITSYPYEDYTRKSTVVFEDGTEFTW